MYKICVLLGENLFPEEVILTEECPEDFWTIGVFPDKNSAGAFLIQWLQKEVIFQMQDIMKAMEEVV